MKILTAEEYALNNMQGADLQEIENTLIGFAKIHVKAALKAASKIDIYTDEDGDGNYYFFQNKKGILNAYPLTNIK